MAQSLRNKFEDLAKPKVHFFCIIWSLLTASQQPKPEIIHAQKAVVEKKTTWAGGKGQSDPLVEGSHTKYEKGEKVIVVKKAVKVTDQLGPPPKLSDLP
jgi:hypothetical protein